ncbi:ATP-binding cassette domain-containing protein [Streptococcus hyovaginalis]
MTGIATAGLVAKPCQLLPKVGLDPDQYLSRLPQDLSGGERQRVGILRAIIANPKVLLMDEPFSALDPISKDQLQELIKDLHEEFGMTTVFVTHDMDEAVKLADRISLMKDGQIVQIGTPDELRYQPVNDFVRQFMQTRGGA